MLQPLDTEVPDWQPPSAPHRAPMMGRSCSLLPLSPDEHGPALYEAVKGHDNLWTYLFAGPFDRYEDFHTYLVQSSRTDDPLFYTVMDHKLQQPVGLVAYLRIFPEAGTIEVGNLLFSPLMQRSTVATEAMYLMMRHAFELGYRRYEWKCHNMNEPSKRAALRLGFQFEGVFRKALVMKGRNRDTAWFSIIDDEWPQRQAGLEAWLATGNFDEEGKQRKRLQTCLQ